MSEGTTVEDLLFRFVHTVEGSGVNARELLATLCQEHPDAADALRAGVATLVEQGLLADPMDPAPGAAGTIAGMRIERTLGAGGMGVVYLAREEATGDLVSLKLIRRGELLGGGRARFQREVEIARKLTFPGIAALRRAGVERTQPYCVFDYVPGISLAQLLQRLAARRPEQLTAADLTAREQPVDERGAGDDASWPRRCALLIAEVADALSHAHSRGVLHRDVKPSNIMLHENGHAVLVDFGLGSLEGAQTLTRSDTRIGSLPYMPPEQALGRRDRMDERSDVYSLGVTLYELLTLRPAYLGGDAASTLALVLAGRAMPPRERNGAIPRPLETICLRAIECQPRHRFAGAAAFARDLRAFAAGGPIASRPPGLARRAREWTVRQPARAVSLAFAIAVVVAVPLVFAWSESRTARRTQALNEELSTSLANSRQLITQLNGALAQSAADAASADRHYEYAREAIVRIVGRVANTSLARAPQMDRVRNEILTASRALYAELGAERPEDQRVARDIAFLARAHAELLFDFGDEVSANAAVQAHEDAIVRLEAAGASSKGLMLERLLVLNTVGAAHLRGLRDEQALAAGERAATLSAALLQAEPDNDRFQRLAATAHVTIALSLLNQVQDERQKRSADAALSCIETAFSIDAEHPENHFIGAGVFAALARVATRTPLEQGPVDLARQALAAAERAVEADAADPRYRSLRAKCRLDLLRLTMRKGGDSDEKRALLARCRAEYSELVVQFPDREDYWFERSHVEGCAAELMRQAGDARGALSSERRRADVSVQRHLASPGEPAIRRQAIVALMTGAFNAISLLGEVPAAARECLGYCDRACEIAGADFVGQGSDQTMRSLKVMIESFAARASGALRDPGIWDRLAAMEQCLPMTFTEATMATAAYLAAVDYLHAASVDATPDQDRLAMVRARLLEHLWLVVDSGAMNYAEIAALPGTRWMVGDTEYDALMERFRSR